MITETILRDAHQSQAATRMTTEQMLPMLDQLDDIGYYSLEAWGGATRFLPQIPSRRPVGKTSYSEISSQKDENSDAFKRSEPFGL